MITEINIARDFSRSPVGRFREDGPHSGQAFREDVLVPSLAKGDVVIILDGTDGYPSSFLEEAFGGLVRLKRWTPRELQKHISIRANAEYAPYRDRILGYFASALRSENG
jgi:hypothetical protein